MTREEALKELAEWREQMKNHGVPGYGKKLTALGVAIEALENAPTENTNAPTNTPTDLISRQDALAEFIDDRDVFDIMESIEELPSAEPQWIPVSERLPERNEIVLVSYKTTNKVHMCKYLDDGSENPWWSYNDDCLAWNNVILAWMPLPPPYEGGETA